ncbi:MAG: hypothetical protein EAS51_09760 [Microbacteriaceae bacterium]|nr:MAG: hypothetical protein EAS51_09760 [Microbacteriaceae bacterium]
MNTTLTPTTRHTTPPHEAATRSVHAPARTLTIVDRAALHLGMALIRWGRRPGRELARHERIANAFELGLLERQREAERLRAEQDHVHALTYAVGRVR